MSKVTVEVPSGKYCNGCIFLFDDGEYAPQCAYLCFHHPEDGTQLEVAGDFDQDNYLLAKHSNCPAKEA